MHETCTIKGHVVQRASVDVARTDGVEVKHCSFLIYGYISGQIRFAVKFCRWRRVVLLSYGGIEISQNCRAPVIMSSSLPLIDKIRIRVLVRVLYGPYCNSTLQSDGSSGEGEGLLMDMEWSMGSIRFSCYGIAGDVDGPPEIKRKNRHGFRKDAVVVMYDESDVFKCVGVTKE